MDQKDFEERMDGLADKVSKTVSDGVKKMESAFAQGKENLKKDLDSESERRRLSGSPRMGLFLVIAGLIWLLGSLGVLHGPIFPIITLIIGIYFLVRSR